jgi:hypothetical protein
MSKCRVYEIYVNIRLRGLFLSTTFPVSWTNNETWMILGICREVGENYAIMSSYARSNANSLTTFRNSLSVPSSWVKNPRKKL